MENKLIVIYKSKTGFTKKYAEMITEILKCTIADYKTVTEEMISKYDTVVFGSRAHAGRIDGYQKVKEILPKSMSNNFILFVTGATPNAAEDVIREFWSQNLSADELTNVPHFYMQSGLCYEKMSLPDKAMMKMAATMMKKKKDKDSNEKGFEQAISSSYDISSKEYIEPLVSFLKSKY